MKSLANLSNSAFSEIQGIPLGLSGETRPRKFSSTDSGLPSVFEDEIFHRLSNRKARKRDSFLACDSAFVRGVG